MCIAFTTFETLNLIELLNSVGIKEWKILFPISDSTA